MCLATMGCSRGQGPARLWTFRNPCTSSRSGNPKFEARNPKQIQSTKFKTGGQLGTCNLVLVCHLIPVIWNQEPGTWNLEHGTGCQQLRPARFSEQGGSHFPPRRERRLPEPTPLVTMLARWNAGEATTRFRNGFSQPARRWWSFAARPGAARLRRPWPFTGGISTRRRGVPGVCCWGQTRRP
jgi:hypothetical protein